MDTSELDYILPKNLIANSPVNPRDHSKLLVINRKTGKLEHRIFYQITDYLGPNDVLVLNKTKVFPARLIAKKDTGGKIEILFLEETESGVWKVLTSPGLILGQKIVFNKDLFTTFKKEDQTTWIKTNLSKSQVLRMLQKYGQTPLPPYINSKETESKLRLEYQTVYAKITGSAAAPTAGFHFTQKLLKKIKNQGVQIEYITLHVGLGTFLPVKTKRLEDHKIHSEHYAIDPKTLKRLKKAKKMGKRIVAVGTTTVRTLESLPKSHGETSLFIYPGYKFKFVDAIITNFHLPKSTLLALIFAFAGKKLIKKAYKEAVKNRYRFYSFGDACFIF